MLSAQNPALELSKVNRHLLMLASIGLIVMIVAVVRPFFMEITDQNGPFLITFSAADLDLDGDTDVLVHNLRKPGEFEAWSGGTLWINQGGAQGGQQGQFASRLNDMEGGRASTTADLNGDGYPDMLVFDGFRLSLGLNQGGEQGGAAGMFRTKNSISPPGKPSGVYSLVTQLGGVVAGDLDGDGRADAIVSGCCGRAFTSSDQTGDLPNVSWTWLNQQGEFGWFKEEGAQIDALEGLPVAEAALGDLDGDGDLDLFAVTLKSKTRAEPGPGSLVLLNDGVGQFTDSGQRLAADGSSSVALGDLDGDGDLDALVGFVDGAEAWINQGGAQGGQAGRFVLSGHRITGLQTRSVRLADLDDDGDLDALVVGTQQAILWWNDGRGQFSRAGLIIPCSERQNLTTGDFNGDGLLDLFVAGYDKTAQVWFGDGKGGMTPSAQLAP